MSQTPHQNGLKNFLGSFTGSNQIQQEKNRLEAFLAAFPGEYCGFTHNGDAIYSQNFLYLLALEKIEGVQDIQRALHNDDAPILEGHFNSLKDKGLNFSIDVQSKDGKRTFQLKGTRGQALSESDYFDILWIEDKTADYRKIKESLALNKELSTTADQFKFLTDNLPYPICMRDDRTRIMWCNNAYATLLNLSVQDVISDQKEPSFSPKDKSDPKTIQQIAKATLKTGEKNAIIGYIVANKKRLPVEIVEIPLGGDKGSVGIINDLSGQENLTTRYERDLSAHETLLEQLNSAIAIFGADQKLEFFNSAFEQLWDLEHHWLNTNPSLGDILEKLRETRRLPEQADFRAYKQGWLNMFTHLINQHEDMLYLPDNTALRLLVVPHPMGGMMMTFEDVTSNLELESSYNTLIAVQKETLDNLSEGVAVYGGDGRLKLCNPAFIKQWHLNPEDIDSHPHITDLSKRMAQIFDENKRKDKKEILISHAIQRKINEGRIAVDDTILLEYRTVPLPDGGVLVSYFDITDSIQVENALRERNTALEEAEQIKTDFLANVSYQLRTPLNAIMGFAEILNDQLFGKLNDKQKEYTSDIQNAGEKLVSLIDDILDLSTIEAGYLDLSMYEFDVFETLNSLFGICQEWARKENVKAILECDENIGLLIADERRIKQILLNLIHNAINFTSENGKITIKANRDNEHFHFIISDTGVGISKQDLERIFEPFERAVSEHRADMSSSALSRGAGLGLSLVKNIAELHGGNVNIESAENEGTTVIVSIPVIPIQQADL
jgi:signal transduction histidine kinase